MKRRSPRGIHRRLATLSALALLATGSGVALGSTAQAAGRAGDTPPSAPTRLTVDDRVDPLAVEGTPQFGWLPQDRDGNEIQSAYEIRVLRDGHGVWDSGKVASSAQSWVRYSGPALDPGTTYQWTVRTWDRDGATSPYAAETSFDSGLGDTDWSGADWIRRPSSGNDARNEWTVARKVLQVPGGSPVVRARAYVAAMGDWALHVNGRQVQRSTSYDYPGEGYYDVAALPDVKAGAPLAVGVLSHYWSCKCQGRANGPNIPEGPSAILAKIVVDHADGTRDVMVSDGTWKVHRYDPQRVDTVTYRNGDAGDYVEYYDATQEMTGWDSASYDASGWADATVIGPHPRPAAASCAGYEGNSAPCTFTHLSAHEAHLSYRTVHPVSVKHLPDGTVFADFGKVYASVPSVNLHGVAGRQLVFTTSYRRNNGTLTNAAGAGDDTVTLATTSNVHVGDEIVVDAPADGYGAGDPESRTVTAVDGNAVSLDAPLARAHANGAWVENSRAGTSSLDTQGSNMHYYYTEKDGAQVARPFTYWGWRYLQISDPGENLTAADISAVVQNTDAPADEASTFSSDNPTLDRVFDLMQRSALQSEQNVFLDTPTREKGQFLGDTVDESFASMAASHERSLTREAIVAFMHSQDRYWSNGAMNAVYPNGDSKRDIPDYTEMFPEWVMRYYQTTGDRSLVAQALPYMKRVADYINAAIDSRGLVHNLPGGSGPYQYGIIDWPAPMRYGSVVDGNGARTVVNSLAVGAFRSVEEAATALSDSATAQTYGARADALSKAMNDQLRDPGTGRWSDGLSDADGSRIPNESEHAQTYPLVYGVSPAKDDAALGAYITSLGMQQGPMDLRQLLQALQITDRPDTMVRLLTDPASDGPAQVLAEGGTYMWEQWTPGCATPSCSGAEVNQRNSESFSHGWGGAGVVGVLEGLLGVRVTGPGASTVDIAPPDKGLRHASGTQWTERGPVTVEWTRTAKGYELNVDVPDNVTATVVLPDVGGSSYRADGAGEPRQTGDANGRTVFTVGSGHSHFVAVPAR